MTKRMLVDATHAEETRVATVDGTRLEDLDFEVASRKMLKGNIYLAKIIRIEPSLQAAFVEYGGNRHGFLAFSEIHPDYYRIPVGDRPEDALDDDSEDLSDSPIITEGPGKLAYANVAPPSPFSEAPAAPSAATAAAAWAGEPGSGTVADLMPGFAPSFGFDNNDSLIRDFSHAPSLVPPLAAPPDSADHAPHSGEVEAMGADDALSLPMPVDNIGGEAADHAPERFVRPRRHNYKIQEVIKRRQVLLIQVVKEERGNKGAALTTFLSLAGRYCVLMPNTAHGGGVSRKITNHQDRRRMKELLDQLDVPEGMALILRTAGMEQEIADIKRDLDYLLRLWNNIREQTLQSSAPSMIYEEADLIKRALRDLYSKSISEILVAGRGGYDRAREFMQMLVPDAVEQIKLYDAQNTPLFYRYQVEEQIDALHSPTVQLRSGGYIVINPTEALISIDVNSGRATRERHIEETALKTNLEAAEEIGRQLRLRDFAGLVVIDFIDMDDGRNNAAVERRLKDSMRGDRARLQIGRISHFGSLELSRQRLRPSLLETNFEKCAHCEGTGYVRSVESTALAVLRGLEQEGIKQRGGDYLVKLPTKVAFYILNNKRAMLAEIQQRYVMQAQFDDAPTATAAAFTIERLKIRSMRDSGDGAVHLDDIMGGEDTPVAAPVAAAPSVRERPRRERSERPERTTPAQQSGYSSAQQSEQNGERNGNGERSNGERNGSGERNAAEPANGNSGNNGNRGGRQGHRSPRPNRDFLPPPARPMADATDAGAQQAMNGEASTHAPHAEGDEQRPRRRGRRGGRRRGGRGEGSERQVEATSAEQTFGNDNVSATANTTQPAAPIAYAPPPAMPRPPRVEIPRSIHELDTTPRADDQPRAYAPAYAVNEAPEKPKGGWWRRLTGQE
jgi:ribonuclease E